VQLSFENKAGYGQIIYVDNINLVESIYSGIPDAPSITGISIFPNPASDEVTASFELPVADKISFIIYDANGRRVLEKNPGRFDPGAYTLRIDTGRLSPGIYRLELRGNSTSRYASLEITR
jgi:hypothetical protein